MNKLFFSIHPLIFFLLCSCIIIITGLRTCVEYGSQVSEEPFEVAGSTSNPFSFAPFKGRMNKLKQVS